VGCPEDRFKTIVESVICSRLVVDGSIEEYQDKVVGMTLMRLFPQLQEDSLKEKELTLLKALMGKIPMFVDLWRPYLGCYMHHKHESS
jgi:hypothetical protein